MGELVHAHHMRRHSTGDLNGGGGGGGTATTTTIAMRGGDTSGARPPHGAGKVAPSASAPSLSTSTGEKTTTIMLRQKF